MGLNQLPKIGLTNTETKVYLALLRIGASQAGIISKESEINRTTTYDALERLIEKGLVKYNISANKKVFSPVAPNRLLDQIKEKERAIEEALPELNKLFEQTKEKQESNIYRGIKGIRSILNDILSFKKYVAFGSSGRFIDIMKHDFYLFQKRKKDLKIKARVILSKSDKKTEQVKVAYTQFRYIEDEFSSPTTTFVYDNKTVTIIWGEVPIATLISNKDVADSYRNHFEALWKVAKK